MIVTEARDFHPVLFEQSNSFPSCCPLALLQLHSCFSSSSLYNFSPFLRTFCKRKAAEHTGGRKRGKTTPRRNPNSNSFSLFFLNITVNGYEREISPSSAIHFLFRILDCSNDCRPGSVGHLRPGIGRYCLARAESRLVYSLLARGTRQFLWPLHSEAPAVVPSS